MKNKYTILLAMREKLKSGLLGHHVIFHHVPKCGGTSLNRALRLRYMLSQAPIMANSTVRAMESFFESFEEHPLEFHHQVHLFRKQMLHYYMSADIAFITGHVGFCDVAYQNYRNRYKFITVLRHPVDRFISDYMDLSVRGASYYKTGLDIEAYLQTDEARIRARTLGIYFSSARKIATKMDADDYALAAENLAKFDLVGFVDQMGEFNQQLNRLLGVKIKIGHENRSIADPSRKKQAFSDSVIDRINEMCAQDVALYEAIRSKSV